MCTLGGSPREKQKTKEGEEEGERKEDEDKAGRRKRLV
jgi:hypothetical protein